MLLSNATMVKSVPCSIRGKIKRRMWIRENNLVLLAPWDFQSDKADIILEIYCSSH